MQKTIYKDVVKIFDDASIPYMVFTTKGFYATEPQRVRDLFVQRCVNFFHQPYGEYDKGGKFEKLRPFHWMQVKLLLLKKNFNLSQ